MESFEADNEFVTTEATGLNTDFRSEGEYSSDEEEIECRNNNATVQKDSGSVQKLKQRVERQQVMEEGEIPNEESDNEVTITKSHRKRISLEENEREDLIGEAVSRMQNLIERTGFIETVQLLKNHLLGAGAAQAVQVSEQPVEGGILNVSQTGKSMRMGQMDDCLSEITVYRNAIQPIQNNQNRDSTSSEEDLANVTDEFRPGKDSRPEIGNGGPNRPKENNIQLLIWEARNNLRGQEGGKTST